ncbi:PaaX family transcriptional regulator C-terminal domain-containing protein [Pontiellaceae bacterium B12227]|nr:PaaX family transcriptional regulator C-terminal domain-containing protein [Pontiellaceae bacterium B12227]
MKWARFHHPDISLPVLRRRIGIEMMELLEMSALFKSRGGWALVNRHTYPNRAAFRNASKRLRDKGLVVYQSTGGSVPKLFLTESGQDQIPDYFSPEKFWNRRWNDIWYMLVYDVPEVDRKYRNILRSFLKRMRMGCLQQSVWVTPEDIRPDFDDLTQTANVDAFAYLLEARTVLGLSSDRIVSNAWNFDRLDVLQEHYCEICEKNIALLKQAGPSSEELAELIRTSLEAYHGAFMEDPLLPSPLLPDNYLGKQAYSMHKMLMTLIEEAGQGVTI